MRRWEARIATIVDKCITTSHVDKERLQSISKLASVSVIPNGVDVDLLKPLPFKMQSKVLLFVGTLQYPPNVDAASYFAREVFPYVTRQIPDATFVIVGSHPPEKIKKLGREKNIVVSGWVEDILPYYEQSAACVVPLRAGGGTRLKILESMALGRPVVSTSIGCEGLDVTEGRDILIADTTIEFAASTVRLLMDADLRRQLSHNARRLVETRYGWEAIGEDLIRVYSELAGGSRIGC
jgi:Glycosyltransferase